MHPFCQHVCLCVQIGEIFFLICILIGQIRFEMAQYILCLIIRPRPYLASLQRQYLRPPAPTVQLHVEHVPPVDDEPLPVRVILPAKVVDGVLSHVRPLGGGHRQAQPRATGVHPLRHRLHEEPRPRLGAVHKAPVGTHGDRLGRFSKRRRDADEPGVHFNGQFRDLQKFITNHVQGDPSARGKDYFDISSVSENIGMSRNRCQHNLFRKQMGHPVQGHPSGQLQPPVNID